MHRRAILIRPALLVTPMQCLAAMLVTTCLQVDPVGIWDLVLKDQDTMRVLQHNQQLALLSITQAIHACNTPLVLPATIVIRISKEDLAMDLVHQIVDQDRMITITDRMTMGTRA